ncbi:acetamidase/formamidase family protein [Paracoccus saliphilus]|uniref:acetamidase/formamidase family protein n=1 Tax=Paracoccus saliphilus TaxID=405559 RepID=UPI002350D726|nr:acetamidase/formamidase family protein [Paracoccus saliphilus]
MCFFWGIPSSSIWLKSLLQGGPIFRGQTSKGALPGEFPETPEPAADASAENPEAYNNVSIFTPISERDGQYFGALHTAEGEMVEFPIRPFMGLMGVASDTSEPVHSVPPAIYGGNLDINELGAGSTLYLPVEVAGALFYTGDPHAAQGDGEVALTALEHSMHPTFHLTVLKPGDKGLPVSGHIAHPMAETKDYWIAIGLNKDLDEA